LRGLTNDRGSIGLQAYEELATRWASTGREQLQQISSDGLGQTANQMITRDVKTPGETSAFRNADESQRCPSHCSATRLTHVCPVLDTQIPAAWVAETLRRVAMWSRLQNIVCGATL
jgi:hypothetical protein